MKHLHIITILALSITFLNCENKDSEVSTNKQELKTNKGDLENAVAKLPFINPPVEGVNIPFETYTINASSGGHIFHPSGSIVSFPPNAFLDANGNIATGNVEVKYREFIDPVGFFFSGIPMKYDSAGVEYSFESAGMCELLAYANSEPVFVNPEHQPEIKMKTKDTRSVHNLYYLDTISQRWINEGKDEVIDLPKENEKIKNQKTLKNETSIASAKKNTLKNLPPPPVAPSKMDGTKKTFIIDLQPGVVPELQAYQNLIFEIADGEKSYNPKDADELWRSVSVKNAEKYGLYRVTFTSLSRKVTYKCKPVFKGADYKQAVVLFEEKQQEYNEKHAETIAKAKAQEEKWKAEEKLQEELQKKWIAKQKAYTDSMKIVNERIERVNRLVTISNLAIQKKNKKVIDYNSNLEALEEKFKKEIIEYEKQAESRELDEALFRSYVAPKFGVWNCDNPNLIKGVYLASTFKTTAGETIPLTQATVIYKNFNGARKYNTVKINCIPNSECMIWSVYDKKLVYLTYSDYKKCNISKNIDEYTFTMKVSKNEITSVTDVKSILKF